MDKKIIIEDYTINWSKQFEDEKVRLHEILDHNVKSIEHIGSTSVIGLGAKPILDIAIGVYDLEIIKTYVVPLQQVGYEFVNHTDFPERRFFRKGQWRAGTHHLHFYQFEGEHWNNQILFRNYLRNNHDVLKQYHQLKLDLAAQYPFDRVSYTKGKTDFVQGVLREAKAKGFFC
ncbi:GrpB family protein [Metabacillus litoralis]|uniref:GrpB family protein n=1 Tax=Metabacillus litoralis TaxID=152268 RepID=UPI000EF62BBB|nr:GrpB family protein [Metabacillus litoralis]